MMKRRVWKNGVCSSCGVDFSFKHLETCDFLKAFREKKEQKNSKQNSNENRQKIIKSQMGLKRTIWERDRYICYYCRLDMRESYFKWRKGEIKRRDCALTVDHIVPQSKGGLWEYNNLVTACRMCNIEKGSKRISAPMLRARIAIHNFVDFVFAKIDSIRHN